MIDIANILINGRYLFKDDHIHLYNGGSSLSFKMDGNGFKVYLSSKPIPGYFYIIIDRDYANASKVLVSDKPFTYSFKERGIHYIDIVKANEATDNNLVIEDIIVRGKLLRNDHQYYKKVRVFGDSTVAGFGILSHNDNPSIHNADSVRDFVYHALYDFNMEMDIVSASGWGLTFSSYTCPKNIGVIDFIDKLCVNSNIDYEDHFKEDIMIISLGCNDNSYISEDKSLRDTRINYFKRQYQNLIDHEIRNNSNLKILMVYGTLKEEDAYYLYEETYEYLKPLYKNLYIHKFKGDNTAISNHAYVAHHDEMAEELKSVIKSLL